MQEEWCLFDKEAQSKIDYQLRDL